VTQPAAAVCPRCHTPLPSGDALVCPACGALVYAATLDRIAAEARWQEQYDIAKAIALWQQALMLLPANSRQYAAIQTEIESLRTRPAPMVSHYEPGALPKIKRETWQSAVLKTGLSMIVSIVVYQLNFGWIVAIGFVLLIFVHEMGHVVANWHYDLPASAPLFIPYVGAVINLRQSPANARDEAIVGIAGPVAGTIGSLACLAWYFASGSQMALVLAWFGFTMNLFNLLPVPPLDGGRVAAAISPWVWVLGLIGLGAMVVDEMRAGGGSGMLIFILIIALPRILRTLKSGGRSGPYYAIGKVAPLVIGLAYLVLLGMLAGLRIYALHHLANNNLI